MAHEISVTEDEMKTVKKMLADLGDSIAQLRTSVESNQAEVRRAMLDMGDGGGESP